MDTKKLIEQLKTGIQFGQPCTFAKFDAASILAQREEWSLLRWFYSIDISKSECAYFLKRSPYRGDWDDFKR